MTTEGEERRWTIYKEPFSRRTQRRSLVGLIRGYCGFIDGPDTDQIVVIPEQDAEQLREAAQKLVNAIGVGCGARLSELQCAIYEAAEPLRAALNEKGKLDGS